MRKELIFALLLICLMALGPAGCSKSPKTAPAAGSAPAAASAQAPRAPETPREIDRTGWPVVVAFGDSLTYGQGVARERNYPSQLQAELDRQGYKYQVINSGVSGDTTSSGIARLEAVLRQKPEIVILELGANDGLRGQPIPQMKQNLAAMIERLQKEKVTVVLAGMQIPPNYGPDYTADFKQTFTDLAAQYKIPLIPFFLDGVGGRADINQADGIHPTAEGYVYVVNNVMGTLEPILKR